MGYVFDANFVLVLARGLIDKRRFSFHNADSDRKLCSTLGQKWKGSLLRGELLLKLINLKIIVLKMYFPKSHLLNLV